MAGPEDEVVANPEDEQTPPTTPLVPDAVTDMAALSLEAKPSAYERVMSPLTMEEASQVDFAALKQQLFLTTDDDQVLKAVTQIRRLLSIETTPPIQQVIDAGMVPRLVSLLDHSLPNMVFETSWALTNVASGNSAQTQFVVEAGAVPKFVSLMNHESSDVAEQAVWALGNIAGDSPQMRDHCLSLGTLPNLLVQITTASKVSLLRNSTWALSNLCRGKPKPSFSMVQPALPALSRLIYSTDEEVIVDALWALSYLSDGPNEHIDAVIDAGVVKKLIELLGHSKLTIVTPALRTIGNIATGSDVATDHVLGAIPALRVLLSSPKSAVRKEALWCLSNITAGNVKQIEAVEVSGVMADVMKHAMEDSPDVAKEACWVITNFMSGGNHSQVKRLLDSSATFFDDFATAVARLAEVGPMQVWIRPIVYSICF